MQYEVTIGIPLYQAADYISRTMESALSQTFGSIEFLVIDDCGNDGSAVIVEHLAQSHPRGSHIRFLRNTNHEGVGYTRNRIIEEAKGKYLYFLDSDDTIEMDTIQKLHRAISSCEAEVAYASYEIIDTVKHSPTRIYQKPDLKLLQKDELASFAFKNSSIFHVSVCNCLIDLKFLRGTGLRFIDAMFWEDMAFTYELVTKVSRAVLLSDITYHYLCRPGSLSHYQIREQLYKKEVLANVSTLDYLKSKCCEHIGKAFLPYMCYNLELNSFYIICHIMKHTRSITPKFKYREMRDIIRHPLALSDVLRFRSMLLQNLLFWLFVKLPVPIFAISVRAMGKLKRAI